MAGKYWTEEEKQFVKENVLKIGAEETAKILGKTLKSIRHFCSNNNIHKELPKIGDKINRLKIIKIYSIDIGSQLKTFVDCECECGKLKNKILLTSVIQNHTKSCGCLRNEKVKERIIKQSYKHGHGNLKSRLYRIWCGIKSRCRDKNIPQYKDYGGRGIFICDEWSNDYMSFHSWSINNGYASNLTIDRINNDDGYYPNNCRWTTYSEQALNRRTTRRTKVFITAFGETKNAEEWRKDSRCIVKMNALFYRLGAGWNSEKALTTPLQRQIKNHL